MATVQESEAVARRWNAEVWGERNLEEWQQVDRLGLLQQLGAVDSPTG